MLSGEEAKRRVAAAIKLAGTTQKKLGAQLAADGFGVTDPERIMQGKKQIQARDADYLAKHTGLPPAWFTEPDLRRLFATGRGSATDDPAALSDFELAEALAEMAEAQLLLERAQGRLQHDDLLPGAGDSG